MSKLYNEFDYASNWSFIQNWPNEIGMSFYLVLSFKKTPIKRNFLRAKNESMEVTVSTLEYVIQM